MKKVLILLSIFLLPQNIFADDDFSFFGSLENRGALMGDQNIPVAETEGEINLAGELVTPRLPVELNLSSTYYFKAGAGLEWRRFDVGVYYTSFFTNSELEDKFNNTYPLSTAPFFVPDPEGGTGLTVDLLPDQHGVSHVTGIATHEFNFKHIDLEVGARFKVANIGFRVSGGMRYAKYTQSLAVERTGGRNCIFGECPDPDIAAVDETDPNDPIYDTTKYENTRQLDMDLEMFGPRLGLSITFPLTKQISFVSAGNWAALFGNRNITDNYETRVVERVRIPPTITPIALAHEGDPEILSLNEGGFIEKDKKTIVHNLELQAGLQYAIKFNNGRSLKFLLGYRYEIHYGVRTTCGGSRIQRQRTQAASYGSCGKRLADGEGYYEGGLPHEKLENFNSHGPFLTTSIHW